MGPAPFILFYVVFWGFENRKRRCWQRLLLYLELGEARSLGKTAFTFGYIPMCYYGRDAFCCNQARFLRWL